jgi:hypothetical protein
MKRAVIVALVVALMMGIGIGNASAANSLSAGTVGLNVTTSPDDLLISGKVFVANSVALLAGLGFGAKGGDAKGTDFAVLLGARKYFGNADFVPFAGGGLEYRSTQDSTVKQTAVVGQFGAEYFLNKQFSIEGSVLFGYTAQEEESKNTNVNPVTGAVTTTTSKVKGTNIGTATSGVSVNFYF